MRVVLGVALALAAAIALNWGFFVQHGASGTIERLSLRHPLKALWLLFRNGRWLAGYAVGIIGWGLYVLALVFAPLSLVQAVSAGGIGLLALFVWRISGVAPTARERAAIGACILGLCLVVASFAASVPSQHVASETEVLAWVGACCAAAALSWLFGGRVMVAGANLGAAAGLIYAAGDVSTKGAVAGSGILLVPLLLGCHLLGFVALQLAFQRGRALATAGLATLVNNALPIIVGVVVFAEHPPGGIPGVARVVGFVLVVIGAALLVRPDPEATGGDPVEREVAVEPSA